MIRLSQGEQSPPEQYVPVQSETVRNAPIVTFRKLFLLAPGRDKVFTSVGNFTGAHDIDSSVKGGAPTHSFESLQ